MNNGKWLMKEIEKWRKEDIVSEETATLLMDRYAPKKNTYFLIVLFSIIGALLIGTGIILIGAKNWYYLPIFVRVAVAFLPLIVSQILAVFTLKYKADSAAWREASAILVCASVFTVVAMVGQIFHLAGDFGTYVLTCGLLSLPMIYILDAASPLLVYYWTIINWAGLDQSSANTPVFLVLFGLGALFLVLNRKREGLRPVYIAWVTALAGFAASIILGEMLQGSVILAVLGYFVLLMSIESLQEDLLLPFKIIGGLGSLVMLAILTNRDLWLYFDEDASIGFSIMNAVVLILSLLRSAKIFKSDKLKATLILILVFVCEIRYIWTVFDLDLWPYEFIFMLATNVILFIIGIGFIAQGTKKSNLVTANIGMVTTCALIIMRFFDSGMDFLWRGIIFLILGTAFLIVNVGILRKKKQVREVE